MALFQGGYVIERFLAWIERWTLRFTITALIIRFEADLKQTRIRLATAHHLLTLEREPEAVARLSLASTRLRFREGSLEMDLLASQALLQQVKASRVNTAQLNQTFRWLAQRANR